MRATGTDTSNKKEKLSLGCKAALSACDRMGQMTDLPQRNALYFPFQPVVHGWFFKNHGVFCPVPGNKGNVLFNDALN